MNLEVSVEEIILTFLSEKLRLSHPEYIFKHHIIETELPEFGMKKFGIMHTPGTYSRTFRRIREHNLHKGYFNLKELETKGREKCFSIAK